MDLSFAFVIFSGYHRLFAHRAYSATKSLRWLLMFLGTGAVQGSIKWWCRDHRAHHRYVDTDRDPYAVIKGFWHAHWGWMLVKQVCFLPLRISTFQNISYPYLRFAL